MSHHTRVFLNMHPQLKKELKEQADAQGLNLTAYLVPYLNAIARGNVRLDAVVENPKFLPKRK